MSIKEEVSQRLAERFLAMDRPKDACDEYRTASHRYPEDKKLAAEYFQAARTAENPEAMADALKLLWLQDISRQEYLDELIRLCVYFNLKEVAGRCNGASASPQSD